MKVIHSILVFLYLVYTVSGQESGYGAAECKIPKCSPFTNEPPFNHSKEDIPQFVIMTFDEAVRASMEKVYLKLSDYKNPNGCPIQATFFVSHVDTNYNLVHDLWRRGHEIAAHSISKAPMAETWKKMNLDGWRNEFGGMKKMLAKYAKIPIKEIIGARAPQLQTAGNVTFTALVDEEFKYDCSQPSRKNTKMPIFPYTLDNGFKSDCQIAPCLKPGEEFPGFWSVPMNDLTTKIPVGNNQTIDRECASVDACILYDKDGNWINDPTSKQYHDMFEENFKRFYNSNRAPFPLFLRDAWLTYDTHRTQALFDFIENILKNYKDVYFVSIAEVIDWMVRGPEKTSLKNYEQKVCHKTLPKNECEPKTCPTYHPNIPQLTSQEKILVVCDDVDCPPKYPWVSNIDGKY